MKEKLLISACLYGINCRYDGKNSILKDIDTLKQKFLLYPFCPEVEGGLPTPRIPSEIVSYDKQNGYKLKNKKGVDTTKEFYIGAKKALDLCKKENIKKALLKSKSPSCSKDFVYDGTFSKKLIPLKGVCADLLYKNKIELFDENDLWPLNN